jgi:hypothetical protein
MLLVIEVILFVAGLLVITRRNRLTPFVNLPNEATYKGGAILILPLFIGNLVNLASGLLMGMFSVHENVFRLTGILETVIIISCLLLFYYNIRSEA